MLPARSAPSECPSGCRSKGNHATARRSARPPDGHSDGAERAGSIHHAERPEGFARPAVFHHRDVCTLRVCQLRLHRHPDWRSQRTGSDSAARSGKAGLPRHDRWNASQPYVGQYCGYFAAVVKAVDSGSWIVLRLGIPSDVSKPFSMRATSVSTASCHRSQTHVTSALFMKPEEAHAQFQGNILPAPKRLCVFLWKAHLGRQFSLLPPARLISCNGRNRAGSVFSYPQSYVHSFGGRHGNYQAGCTRLPQWSTTGESGSRFHQTLSYPTRS